MTYKDALFLKRASSNELSLDWFTNRGYTKNQYNEYKNFGYTLQPTERQQQIHDQIMLKRRINAANNPSVKTNTVKTPNGTTTTRTFNGRYKYGRPLSPSASYRPVPTRKLPTQNGSFR